MRSTFVLSSQTKKVELSEALQIKELILELIIYFLIVFLRHILTHVFVASNRVRNETHKSSPTATKLCVLFFHFFFGFHVKMRLYNVFLEVHVNQLYKKKTLPKGWKKTSTSSSFRKPVLSPSPSCFHIRLQPDSARKFVSVFMQCFF